MERELREGGRSSQLHPNEMLQLLTMGDWDSEEESQWYLRDQGERVFLGRGNKYERLLMVVEAGVGEEKAREMGEELGEALREARGREFVVKV